MKKFSLKRAVSLLLCLSMILSAMSFMTVMAAAADFEIPAAGKSYTEYPSMKETYRDYFLLGTAGESFSGNSANFVKYQFNAFTPENSMKPQGVQGSKGNFNFGTTNNSFNSMINLVPDAKLIGHTLAWHSQSPSWMWDSPNFNKETALANLNAHIDAVMGNFGVRLHSVDVVNEAIGSVSNPTDWQAALQKGEGWVLALGYEWVELAFLRAAEVVDKNGWDCKLYYNDFGLDGTAKARATYEMIKAINTKYAGTRPNGKLLIEGIGMQGHYNMNTNLDNVEANIKLFASLGVSISITELDLEIANDGSGTLAPEQAVKQGLKYAKLFQLLKKYAAGPANTNASQRFIERVTFWGLSDGHSWRSGSLPMPFTSTFVAKEGLLGVLYPDEYIALNDKIDEPAPEPKPVTDGIHVYNSVTGTDGWSGANIIIGNNSSVWPYSTSSDGKVAFVPEKGATYRISLNYTAQGTAAVRIRWIKDNSNGNYTKGDADTVGSSQTRNPNQVATRIPAYFNSGMSNGNTYTLVTEIKLTGEETADGLIGNFAIRGGSGGNNFIVNEIKIEKIATGGADELLTIWPPAVKVKGVDTLENTLTSSVIEDLGAIIPLHITGEELTGKSVEMLLKKDGNVIESFYIEAPSDDFITNIKLDKAPKAGDYTLTAGVYESDKVSSVPLTIIPYNKDIWTAVATVNEQGKLRIAFAVTALAPKSGVSFDGLVTVNGLPVSGTAIVPGDGVTYLDISGIDYTSLESGDVVKITGVKFPLLFQSYSFTFTIVIQ